ncbi:hypothetical protein H5410_061047 [Solanum commersonii]|uniref:Uncharacterized protein n=1 Tax=Solanum commersonii TaxID=4109 RepID=A0A9J5W727_SOLCO|nr:hypothetical protein H5410_061047 [Solanum commersonii]
MASQSSAFFSSLSQLPCSILLYSVHALSLTPNTLNSRIYIIHQFKKDVSNSATQDSIMNVHKKYQLTWARINCALNDSSCDSPLPNNLKLTTLASNASLSSTKVFKCPHKKNDSIVTQWFNQLKFWNQDQHSQ